MKYYYIASSEGRDTCCGRIAPCTGQLSPSGCLFVPDRRPGLSRHYMETGAHAWTSAKHRWLIRAQLKRKVREFVLWREYIRQNGGRQKWAR
jgi:hypothetical protein